RLTLNGKYGARTTKDDPARPDTSMLYIGAPIYEQDKIIGVLTVGKSTGISNDLIAIAEAKILYTAAACVVAAILFGLLLSGFISSPINALIAYARSVRDGARTVPQKLHAHEMRELLTAFEEMRISLEGKEYLEQYMQTSTHELKSPISAIHGA